MQEMTSSSCEVRLQLLALDTPEGGREGGREGGGEGREEKGKGGRRRVAGEATLTPAMPPHHGRVAAPASLPQAAGGGAQPQ